MSRVTIGPMSLDHVEGLRDCVDAVARERRYLATTAGFTLEETERFVLDLAAHDDISLVALDGDQLIGWCDIRRSRTEGFAHGGTLGMGVAAGYRGQGIGKRLLAAALEQARARGLERVQLDVFTSNKAAVALYRAFGFREEGRRVRGRKLDGAYDDVLLMAVQFEG
ncbi:MAG: GNAT family N-acetyltransferase [Pirellulales bacterium]